MCVDKDQIFAHRSCRSNCAEAIQVYIEQFDVNCRQGGEKIPRDWIFPRLWSFPDCKKKYEGIPLIFKGYH